MRSALAARLVLLLGCGVVACKPGGGGQQDADVHVVSGDDGGSEASVPEASVLEAGLGLGAVDRAGHPLATVLLVPGALQDEYNAQPSFEPIVPRVLQDALEARLVAFDTLALGEGGPDPVDWPIADGGTHPLLPVFVSDVLLVDTALSCSSPDGGFASSYLEIEREIDLGGSPHVTCGGRTPADGVVDETLTLLVTRGRTPVNQGISGPTRAATTTFPYLAAPK